MTFRHVQGLADEVEFCSKCRAEPRLPGQRWCRRCFNTYMRAWRAPYAQLSAQHQLRARTRAYTNVLVRRGHLMKLPCALCQELEVEAHHPDYADPRTVIWLCRAHNRGQRTNPRDLSAHAQHAPRRR